jgi:hypothetical protein
VSPDNFGNPAILKSQDPWLSPLCLFRPSGPLTLYGEQASHDYSWFGFIGFCFLIKYLARSMPFALEFLTQRIYYDSMMAISLATDWEDQKLLSWPDFVS